MKKAFVTGITGQDGSYLVEFLLNKGYEVHGLIRDSSCSNSFRIDHLIKNEEIYKKTLFLHFGDLTDSISIEKIIGHVEPDEIYNLAAQSHVGTSFEIPEVTGNTNALGVLRLLETVKNLGLIKKTKIYQASTSELFGKVQETPQKETTPFYPRSPYGVAKLYAYWMIKNYRESYGMFACNGILFNHEGKRRGSSFVTRKITLGLSRIKLGLANVLELGNLDAKRDWGNAEEYVEAMWLMLQQEKPEDFVVATSETHTIQEFIEICCKELKINLGWEGSGLDKKGIDLDTGKTIIKINPKFFRPTEVDLLVGDTTKAREKLNWSPKTKFSDLAKLMANADYELLKSGKEINY